MAGNWKYASLPQNPRCACANVLCQQHSQATMSEISRIPSNAHQTQCLLWVAPALQEFFGDFRGRFVSTVVCPTCLRDGIVVTGPPSHRCKQRLPGSG